MVGAGEPDTALTPKGLAVATVAIARYLATQNPSFALFLRAACDHAAASGLSEADLAFLELLISSVA